jgi:hypothetical protein
MVWLAGGAAAAVGVDELCDARHVVSDLAAVGMELAAAVLAAAQASGRGGNWSRLFAVTVTAVR